MASTEPRPPGTASGHPAGSRLRAAAPWLLLLGLAWLGWRALSLGLADHWAESNPARALAWRPDHPEALLRRAEQLAAEPAHAGEAAELARRALRAHPLDGRPHRVLGQLADQAGDREAASKHYQRAVQLSPRDVPATAWMADWHLARGEFAEGLAHVDRLLRAEPELRKQLEPVLIAAAQFPPAQQPFAEVLAGNPPWRLAVLRAVFRAEGTDIDALTSFVESLRSQPGGLAEAELGAWVERLGREGRWGAAYLTWAASLPPERLQGLGNVYNGGFEWAPGQGGFDWRFDRVAGARVDRLFIEGAGGQRALRLAFDDRRVPFRHVRQRLALAPGRYELRGRAKPDGLRSERGLVWTVSCANGRGLGDSEPLSGRSPWREFRMEFEVPAGGCEGQWLILRLPARIAAEQRIGGQIWFDDLAIRRLPALP